MPKLSKNSQGGNERLGFDPVAAIERLENWLKRHPTDARADAVRAEASRLVRLAEAHAPVLDAERRWADDLQAVAHALQSFLPRARQRASVLSLTADRAAGRSASVFEANLNQHEALIEHAKLLLMRVQEHRTELVASGRPSFSVLGGLEARLSLAGFGTAEIARLIPDSKRVENSPRAQHAHRRRIEARRKSYKGPVQAEVAGLADFHAWYRKHGDPSRKPQKADRRAFLASLGAAQQRTKGTQKTPRE